jgi:hypothetical protein
VNRRCAFTAKKDVMEMVILSLNANQTSAHPFVLKMPWVMVKISKLHGLVFSLVRQSIPTYAWRLALAAVGKSLKMMTDSVSESLLMTFL